MSTGRKVFVIGPGFIGWNVIDLLVAEGYSVTGLVRRKEHADGIKASGASVVMGNLDDKALITEQSALHDIIIHTATADHLPSVEAILDGLKQRAAKDQMTIFVHTSGTSVLDDESNGRFRGEKVYSDKTRDEIDSVPEKAPHRNIDLAIVKAQKELGDKAKMAIIIPPMIYGSAHGRLSIQVPTMARFALKHGWAPYVGKGLGIESNIHVLDLARAYITVLHHLESPSPASTQMNPYFFCECTVGEEPSWYDYAALVASALHQVGKKVDSEPRHVTEDLYGELFGPMTAPIIGMNSRSRAVRLRELGWEPREKDWKRSFVEDEMPEILKENNQEFSGYMPAGAKASG